MLISQPWSIVRKVPLTDLISVRIGIKVWVSCTNNHFVARNLIIAFFLIFTCSAISVNIARVRRNKGRFFRSVGMSMGDTLNIVMENSHPATFAPIISRISEKLRLNFVSFMGTRGADFAEG